MTNEQLLARKTQLEASRAKNAADIEAVRANLQLLQAADHTMHGAIQDCDFWIEANNTPPDSGMIDAHPAPEGTPNAQLPLLQVLKGRRDSRKGASA